MDYKNIDPRKNYDEHSEFWDYVYERDNRLCQHCGGAGNTQHHVKYRSRGGDNKPNNVILLCCHCHDFVHNANYPEHMLFNTIERNEKRFRKRLI